MRKKFTQIFSLLVILTSFAFLNGYAQEDQETVELYAETATACFDESNDYTVEISVRDFIQLTEFDLDLEYNDAVFTYVGADGMHSDLTGGSGVTESAGVITWDWSQIGTPVTIGDNQKTGVLTLHFSLNDYPNNVAASYSSDMDWEKTIFSYTVSGDQDTVNTVVAEDGSLTVSVSYSGIETVTSTEDCAGGDVTLSVTSPVEAAMYLFNEDPDPADWVGAWSTSPDYLAAAGETVTVRVKDASGCMSLEETVVIPEVLEPVAFTVQTQDPDCFGEKGSVVFSVSGGTPPYTYYIIDAADPDPEATIKYNFQFSQEPGTYWVAVQDANGCADLTEEGYWQEITITDVNSEVLASATSTGVNCNGGDDGAITAAGAGGVGDYTYSIDGTTWQTSTLFDDLPAGIYTVEVMDGNGCTDDTIDVVIDEPVAMTFDIAIVDVSCGGDDDGEIAVTNIVGGTAPYILVIEEDGNLTTESGVVAGFTFTGLLPTYYSLTITDDNGCVVEYDNPNGTGNVIAVQSPDDINFVLETTNPLCNGYNATITVTSVEGGTGSYVYSFDGGAFGTAPTFAWVSPYDGVIVEVRNADATCGVTQNADPVVEPVELTADITDVFPPTCKDGTDGNIHVNITGGTLPYYYSINGGSWKESSDNLTIIKAMVGNVVIDIKDANGCEIAAQLNTTVTLEPNEITAAGNHIDCYNVKGGAISVEFISWATETGTEAYPNLPGVDDVPARSVQYWVENEAGVVTTFTPSNHGTPTDFYAGTYNVWVVDQYTCVSNKVEVEITENPELIITDVNANGASCYGTFEGTITIQATGGTIGGDCLLLQYAVVNNMESLENIEPSKWLDFETYDAITTLSTVSFHVDGGTYWIAVRDCGCDEETFGPIVVDGYDELLVDEDDIVVVDPTCYDDSDGSITVPMSAVTGGAGSYLFTLLDDGGSPITGYIDLATGEFTGLEDGDYYVLVEDAENCPSYTTEEISIDEPDELYFDAEYLHMSCENSNNGLITITAYGGTGNYWYAINNDTNWLPFEDGENEKTYIATEPGTFSVSVKDEHGCIDGPYEVTILEPTAIVPVATVTANSTCNGSDDGAITVSATGGWATMSVYQFKVDNGSWQSGFTFSGLSAGVHTLYVRDIHDYSYDAHYQDLDCIYDVDFTITEPGKITYDVVIENVKCKDGADGTFTVTILSGGTPWNLPGTASDGYNVQLTGDAYDSGIIRTGADFAHTFTGLAHSMYTVYITDSEGCTIDPTVGDSESPYTTEESWEVSEPATMLDLEATWIKDADCYNDETGQFSVIATGGVGPYVYYTDISIEDDGHVLIPEDPTENSDWQESDIFNVGAGTWVVWAMDANGCIIGGETDDSGTPVNEWRVKIEQPDQILWDFDRLLGGAPDYDMPLCNGSSNGVIYLEDIEGGSGTYNATVTGTSAAGEAVALSYSDIGDPNATLNGVPASDAAGFEVTVTDDNGCTSVVRTIDIDEPDAMVVSLVKGDDQFVCPDAIEGFIETYATGGDGDYEYQLLKDDVIHTPWQNLASAFLVQVGHTFIVQVRDGNDCIAEDTIDIYAPDPIEFTVQDLTCYGDVKASARITATGGEDRLFKVFYQEIVDGSAVGSEIGYNGYFASTIDIMDEFLFDNENLQDRHYKILVRDEQGCESQPDTVTFDLVQHKLLLEVDVVAENECSTDVLLRVTGGTPDYVVTLDGDTITEMTQTLSDGSYEIVVTDAHLVCMADTTLIIATTPVERDTTVYTDTSDDVVFTDVESGIDTVLTVGETHVLPYDYVECPRVLNVTVEDNVAPTAVTMTPQGELGEDYTTFDLVLELSEDVIAGAGSLTVYNGATAEHTFDISEVTIDGNTITVPVSLDKFTTYFVYVDAGFVTDASVNAFAGITLPTDWTFMTGDFPTPIDPDFDAIEFKVYPNPFGDIINIVNHDKLSRVVMSNIAGQRVIDVEYPNSEIRTSSLVSGVYLISFITEEGIVKTERIIKK